MAAREAAQEVASNTEFGRRSDNFGNDAQSRSNHSLNIHFLNLTISIDIGH